jgi:pimeloyl-ACP methyl ester carboxylesterase
MQVARYPLVLLSALTFACKPTLPPVAPESPLAETQATDVTTAEPSGDDTAAPLAAATAELDRPVDELVDIGGRSLHVHCEGSGSPLVVLDAGLGDDGRVWNKVQPGVAKLTRTCAYDRLGLGQSSEAPARHSIHDMTVELHLLLEKLAPQVPRVLVAHSLSGLIARLYASRYPGEIVGLVLVDAATEDQDTRAWPLLAAEHYSQLRSVLDRSPEHLGFEGLRTGMAELRRADRDLGNRPLVVLTSARPQTMATTEVDPRLIEVWIDMQKDLVELSTNSRHTVTDQSGHYIHVEEPALVVEAVSEVLEKRPQPPNPGSTNNVQPQHSLHHR